MWRKIKIQILVFIGAVVIASGSFIVFHQAGKPKIGTYCFVQG